MIEADVWRAIIAVLRDGLDANGLNSIAIKQNFQPLKQGVDVEDTIYLHKVTSRRYGHQGRNYSYDDINTEFDAQENYWLEATFQLTALIKRDVDNSSSTTSYDIVDTCSAILQSMSSRKKLIDSGIGILRVSEIRNQYNIDDYDQYDQDPSFDFVLTYSQKYNYKVPIAAPIVADIQRV